MAFKTLLITAFALLQAPALFSMQNPSTMPSLALIKDSRENSRKKEGTNQSSPATPRPSHYPERIPATDVFFFTKSINDYHFDSADMILTKQDQQIHAYGPAIIARYISKGKIYKCKPLKNKERWQRYDPKPIKSNNYLNFLIFLTRKQQMKHKQSGIQPNTEAKKFKNQIKQLQALGQ